MWKSWRQLVATSWLASCFGVALQSEANVREAQHTESRADFVHKCKIAAKEAEETDYWLQLCTHAPNYPTPPIPLNDKLLSVRRLLARIIISSKANAA
ncbi:four helix bundle protein [Hymenobacter siberiensis]|uniref:four helix bundle protein n=1 Tax=Hymenobacter siberiensis TaxID=2848396 RepID=UPI001D00C833